LIVDDHVMFRDAARALLDAGSFAGSVSQVTALRR
jgi:hypothetical protein